MVTLLLRGGLGNQMFQFATGLCLAKKNNTELRLDPLFLREYLPGRKQRTDRDFGLDMFHLDSTVRFTKLSRLAEKLPIPGLWLALDFAAIWMRNTFGRQKLIRQDGHDFDSSLLDRRGNLLLFGYWQSEAYFGEVSASVREAFRFRWPLYGEATQLREQITSTCSISLHVRRGDYVELNMVNNDLSYYDRATAYLAERIESRGEANPIIFVFSDDIAWCRQNLQLSLPTVYVNDSSAGPRASSHLHLMSLCRHNIIANSTFSWWAAWLNSTPGKIVIAPKQWYSGRASETLVPNEWILL
jgi:hypothetical protein